MPLFFIGIMETCAPLSKKQVNSKAINF